MQRGGAAGQRECSGGKSCLNTDINRVNADVSLAAMPASAGQAASACRGLKVQGRRSPVSDVSSPKKILVDTELQVDIQSSYGFRCKSIAFMAKPSLAGATLPERGTH